MPFQASISRYGNLHKMGRVILLIVLVVFSCHKLEAQNTMRINYKDGSVNKEGTLWYDADGGPFIWNKIGTSSN